MNIENAIESVWRLTQRGAHFPKEWEGKLSPREPEECQLGLLNRSVAAGDAHVGWKVGLTSKAPQTHFGRYAPIFGFLLRGGAKPSGTTFAWSELIRPGFEHELCLTVGETLQGPDVTLEQARAAISAAAPALEIVELRGDLRRDLSLVLTDNAGQKAFVTGEPTTPIPANVELGEVRVDVFVNGTHMEQAQGTEVLGNSSASVAWFANKLAEFGLPLDVGM